MAQPVLKIIFQFLKKRVSVRPKKFCSQEFSQEKWKLKSTQKFVYEFSQQHLYETKSETIQAPISWQMSKQNLYIHIMGYYLDIKGVKKWLCYNIYDLEGILLNEKRTVTEDHMLYDSIYMERLE
jgi:hypothetical protein